VQFFDYFSTHDVNEKDKLFSFVKIPRKTVTSETKMLVIKIEDVEKRK
jgi:hypothetical protein